MAAKKKTPKKKVSKKITKKRNKKTNTKGNKVKAHAGVNKTKDKPFVATDYDRIELEDLGTLENFLNLSDKPKNNKNPIAELAEKGAREFLEGRETVTSDEKWFSDDDWRKGIAKKKNENENENENGNSRFAQTVYKTSEAAVVDDLDKMLSAKNAQHKLELLEEKIANKTRDFLKVRRELLLLKSALSQAYEKIDIEKVNFDDLFEDEKTLKSLFDNRLY